MRWLYSSTLVILVISQSVFANAGINVNIPMQQAIRLPDFSAIGKWRGVFIGKSGLEIPFNFEVVQSKSGKQVAYFINADERFEAGTVRHAGDSLFVSLDQFDNELAFKIVDGRLTGVLRRQDQSGQPLALEADKDKNYRFAPNKMAPVKDLSGTYDMVIQSAEGKNEKAVLLLTQMGSKLSGTVLRVTGDSRYLEGVVEGSDFYLSSFIGSSPSYYKGGISDDGKLKGEIISVRGGSTSFIAAVDDNAALPDPYTLTYLKDGYTSLDFSFPDVNGKKISLSDPKFKNKVVVITITGTWCPNCIDEAAFLAPWYKTNKARGVEAIAIHYERKTDSAFVQKVLSRFRTKFDIQYDQLIAGTADKQFVASSLPALNTFLSFPTIIFIDKKGKVAKIHTGYSGPATGHYYDQFVKEFNEEVDGLLRGK